ncbi:hypothetical protein BDP55DRAFT_285033 [Colletotrichum godetiae]|uniref:Uncharacterized protein n=1 Tax=Colletotrichum godetiae TaxID=1209918 RepID=A0AAJ0ADI3_9PEZI|nr:uncharacterized protein BDP55DRAFT_285033 [Colletotrichum godetiae]KAK1671877.1 hypothetical protein BDP55DRAFT_285033 [Colletotrichum godetiae]
MWCLELKAPRRLSVRLMKSRHCLSRVITRVKPRDATSSSNIFIFIHIVLLWTEVEKANGAPLGLLGSWVLGLSGSHSQLDSVTFEILQSFISNNRPMCSSPVSGNLHNPKCPGYILKFQRRTDHAIPRLRTPYLDIGQWTPSTSGNPERVGIPTSPIFLTLVSRDSGLRSLESTVGR